MSQGHFRIDELNLFKEWHLHATAASLEIASESAREIARKIGRRTRVLDKKGAVLMEVVPKKCCPSRGSSNLGINPVLDLVLDPDHLVGSDLDLSWEGPGSDLAIDAGAGQGGHFLDLRKA